MNPAPDVSGKDTVYGSIEVRGARENNLRGINLDIPKRKLTVFTGVSGSGKSSLVFGTIAAESQRLINETYTAFVQSFLPSLGRPDVDSLENLSAAIIVDQKPMAGNSRSTVGTATDAWSMLRLLYSRLGTPNLGSISAFSFNDAQGMCPTCAGIGSVTAVDPDGLVDRSLSLNQGAITFPQHKVGSYPWAGYANSGFFDADKPLAAYTGDEWQRLMFDTGLKVTHGTVTVSYEGLVPRISRLYLSKGADDLRGPMKDAIERAATFAPCPDCGGTRLNEAARSSLISGHSIADCASMQVSDLLDFLRTIAAPKLEPMLVALRSCLERLVHVGLGYLSLDRQSSSLSGGESQRVKMVRHLGSPLTDLTYIFDEPSIGLHAHDIEQFNQLLLQLRDKGNTVLVVEHKPTVIAIADHVVDLGPGAGSAGGEIVFAGPVEKLTTSNTLTGRHFTQHQAVKRSPRTGVGALRVSDAVLHNLRGITVDIPTGVLTAVTGVAGSGKSSLIRGVLPQQHANVVIIDQHPSRASKRSSPATYSGVADPIRKLFAKANGVDAALFSANSQGACPECKGLGVLYTDLLFMQAMASTCEVCHGERFTPQVLAHTVRGSTISGVLRMSIDQAAGFFTEKSVRPMLARLADVGLGYLTLGQPLTTLAGGERQRLELAVQMAKPGQVYVLDEPTTGLHMADVDNLIGILDRLVDTGATVIVIEHNLDVVTRADWVIDIGPGAGHDGGTVVFEGTPAALVDTGNSTTAEFLRRHLDR
jgi:excinuclease UvrABC ATPase subunit